MVLWGVSPTGKTGSGASCQLTCDCEPGYICENGKCVIPYYANCYGANNENYCMIGSRCVNSVCIPLSNKL